MKVLICGAREWKDYNMIWADLAELSTLHRIDLVIDGQAHGADSLGHLAAVRLGLPTLRLPANWERYGRAAGPIRNRAMLREKPDLVLAYHDWFPASKGTKDMVTISRKAGVEVRVRSHNETQAAKEAASK